MHIDLSKDEQQVIRLALRVRGDWLKAQGFKSGEREVLETAALLRKMYAVPMEKG